MRCLRSFPALLVLGLQVLGMAQAMAADAGPAATAAWRNCSEAFLQHIGAQEAGPAAPFLRRCQGLIVTPTGEIVILTAQQGICRSPDGGATWSIVADNGVAGRCENGFGQSLAYPYDGRMAFFAYDGANGRSGGMSLDGGRHWQPFTQWKRGLQFGDVDWHLPRPQTLIGETHEPFFTVLSTDGGTHWRQLDPDESGDGPFLWVGLVDATHLLRYRTHQRSLEWSPDQGVTWTAVAYFRVTGNRPVHYGQHLYWTTAKGVITSTDGQTWEVTGPGAEGACDGPFFGLSEQEFVVVTKRHFLRTTDGGKTWTRIADAFIPPDVFRPELTYFGWDATHHCLYASGLGASVYQLRIP